MSIRKQFLTLVVASIPFASGSVALAGNCGHGGGHIASRISAGISQHFGGGQSMGHYSGHVHSHGHVHVQDPAYYSSVPSPVYTQAVPAQYTVVGGNAYPQGYAPVGSSSPVQVAPSQNPVGAPVAPRAPQPRVESAPQQAPMAGQSPSPNPTRAAAPQQGQLQGQPVGAPQNSNVAASGAPTELSALQLLASMQGADESLNAFMQPSAGERAVESLPVAAAAMSHVGQWQVNLPNNQLIQLQLNGDNSFTWVATKEGKSNSFDGQYRLDGGRLVLVRSNDLQQMAGDWAGQEGKFTFKLDGATSSGLDFVRSE